MSTGPTSDVAPFWAAAEADKLVLPKCRACARFHWHPRAICPYCMSSDIEWVASPGRGTIYSFTVFRRQGDRIIAYVELDEGLRILTNIHAPVPRVVRIGLRVEAAFVWEAEGGPRKIPVFTPVA